MMMWMKISSRSRKHQKPAAVARSDERKSEILIDSPRTASDSTDPISLRLGVRSHRSLARLFGWKWKSKMWREEKKRRLASDLGEMETRRAWASLTANDFAPWLGFNVIPLPSSLFSLLLPRPALAVFLTVEVRFSTSFGVGSCAKRTNDDDLGARRGI